MTSIQNRIRTAIVLFVLGISPYGFARASDFAGQASFWDDLRGLVQKCGYRTHSRAADGSVRCGNVQSACPELRVSGNTAWIFVDGSELIAILSPSGDADRHDLNHLDVFDRAGNRVRLPQERRRV